MATKKTNTTGKKRMTKKEKARKKRNRIILVIAEVVLLLVMLIALYFIVIADKVETPDLNEDDIKINEGIDEDVNPDDIEQNGGVSSSHMKGYRNIALFGVDSRNGALGKGTLSDTIIIASINEETKDVRLVSVYRDTYLNSGNDSYNKANHAYSYGGPLQAINMLNMNLDLNITDYITVGFRGVVDTVDALGGVTIDVDSEELVHLNNYQVETSDILGRSYNKLSETGMVRLDGIQAVSYCRIRYTAGDDYKRAERQREVIQAIVDNAKGASPTTLNTIANKAFSQVSTSLELDEILGLIGDLGEYSIAETGGFPFDEYRTTGSVKGQSSVIPVDLETNVRELHKFLFDGAVGYEPSDNVKEYSAKIRQDTGK